MTVADINRMPHREYVGWQVYLGRKRQREELEAAKARAKGGGGR